MTSAPATEPPGAIARGAIAGYGGRPPRRIAVVPAYNEEPMVAAVLDELYPLVDELVVVDDGSTDRTRAEIEHWLPGHDRCQLLWHDVNQGMSEAYILALTTLRERLNRGELSPNDLVFTVDADGQHDIAVLDELVEITIDEGLDAMLAQRDLSYHGPYKKLGNFLLSGWASLWAGNRLHDVESGYRIFRLGSLAHALDFYTGYKYSETVEVAVVMSRLGYRVRNDHVVPVPESRSRTRLRDALIDLAVIPVAAARVWLREPRTDRQLLRPRRRRSHRGVLGRSRCSSRSRSTAARAASASCSSRCVAALAAAVIVRRARAASGAGAARADPRRDRRVARSATARHRERGRARRRVHCRRRARGTGDSSAASVRARGAHRPSWSCWRCSTHATRCSLLGVLGVLGAAGVAIAARSHAPVAIRPVGCGRSRSARRSRSSPSA